jgi:hypothetical protein
VKYLTTADDIRAAFLIGVATTQCVEVSADYSIDAVQMVYRLRDGQVLVFRFDDRGFHGSDVTPADPLEVEFRLYDVGEYDQVVLGR